MMAAWWRESPTPAPADERTLALLNLPSRPDGYAPIADYALIGDTRTAALIARDGSLDWLCLPNVDDASVFAALLDRERGGRFFVGAPGEAEITRRYLDGSPILVTRFVTPDGVFEVTDLMPLALSDANGPLEPGRQVVRMVEALEGRPRFAIHFAPRPGYAATLPRLRQTGRGSTRPRPGPDDADPGREVPLRPGGRAARTALESRMTWAGSRIRCWAG